LQKKKAVFAETSVKTLEDGKKDHHQAAPGRNTIVNMNWREKQRYRKESASCKGNLGIFTKEEHQGVALDS